MKGCCSRCVLQDFEQLSHVSVPQSVEACPRPQLTRQLSSLSQEEGTLVRMGRTRRIELRTVRQSLISSLSLVKHESYLLVVQTIEHLKLE